MTKNITRENITLHINEEFGLSKNDCHNIVNDIIELIVDGLIKDNIIKIHNFGTFKISQKESRLGRNPKSKVEVMIPPRKVISFVPSRHTLNKINKRKSE